MSETARIEIDGKSYEFPVVTGSEGERGIDISKLRELTGVITLDPGFKNTGSCQSEITFIDGEQGILRYRGYPIEELAEKSNFLEVAYLLIHGELPTPGAVREVGDGHSLPHDAARGPEALLHRVPEGRAPDGGRGRRGRGALDLLPQRARSERRAPGLDLDRSG